MKKEKIYNVFSHMPRLTTSRLILRPMHVTDAYDMYEYACREDLTEYLLWSPHPSVDYTRDYLAYIQSRYSKGEFYDWAITLKDTGKMIGTVGFTKIDCPHNSAEIGYVLNPDYHGVGLGSEAAAEILRFGFGELRLHRIEARFMQGNDASLAVMKKLGMTFEGYHRDSLLVKGKYRTIGFCSILEQDYCNKV
jgi:ribosomal-protein-alanine N-acetyltransferase